MMRRVILSAFNRAFRTRSYRPPVSYLRDKADICLTTNDLPTEMQVNGGRINLHIYYFITLNHHRNSSELHFECPIKNDSETTVHSYVRPKVDMSKKAMQITPKRGGTMICLYAVVQW